MNSSVLVADFIVLPGKALTLLLQILEILLLLRELLLQICDLTSSTGLLNLRCLLSGRLGVALVLLDLGFELERFEDLGLLESGRWMAEYERLLTIMYVRLRIRERKRVKPQRYMLRCE